MKTKIFLMLAGIALLASCTEKDLFNDPVTPEEPSKVSKEDIQANVQKVFGVTFDANHDWRGRHHNRRISKEGAVAGQCCRG